MEQLSAKGMKALKVVHLVCVIVWFGSAISMNLLRLLVEADDPAGLYWMAAVSYTHLTLPTICSV